MESLLTSREAADYLDVRINQFYKLVHTKQIPIAYQGGHGNGNFFLVDDLQQLCFPMNVNEKLQAEKKARSEQIASIKL